MPSRKKGRFSEKNSSFRGSKRNCPASDSTCEKSGFAVALKFRLLVTPQRTLPPSSGRAPVQAQPPSAPPPRRHPAVLRARVLYLARDVDPPALLLRRLKPQALERDPDLD